MTLCGSSPLPPPTRTQLPLGVLAPRIVGYIYRSTSLQPRLTLAQVEAGGDVLINTTRRRKDQTRNIQIPK